jgi:hypothetical protein
VNGRALAASPLGFAIGVSLGALGGGGSILAVPVLVYVAGQSVPAATSSSLVLVIIGSLVGIVPHWRNHRVHWPLALVFAGVGLFGTAVGSQLNTRVDPDVLLLMFAGVLAVAGVMMYRNARRGGQRSARAARWRLRRGAEITLAGSAVGFLTGFFGVGGGFVVVPTLVLVLGVPMTDAAGTSLAVILINSVTALAMRAGNSTIETDVLVPFALATIAGVATGARLAGRTDAKRLQMAFVGLIGLVAVYVGTRATLSLSG